MDYDTRCSSVSLIVSVVLILTGLYNEPRPEVEPPSRSPTALLDELAYNINNIPEYVSYNTDWYPTATGYERIPEPPREPLLKQLMSLVVHLRELLDLPSDTDLSSDPAIAFAGYVVLSVLATIASSWIYGRLSRYGPLLPRCISIGPTLKYEALFPRIGPLTVNLLVTLWCYIDSDEDRRVLRELLLLLLVFPIGTSIYLYTLRYVTLIWSEVKRHNVSIWQYHIVPGTRWLVQYLHATIQAAVGRMMPTRQNSNVMWSVHTVVWNDPTTGRAHVLKIKAEFGVGTGTGTASELYNLNINTDSHHMFTVLLGHLKNAEFQSDRIVVDVSHNLPMDRVRPPSTRDAGNTDWAANPALQPFTGSVHAAPQSENFGSRLSSAANLTAQTPLGRTSTHGRVSDRPRVEAPPRSPASLFGVIHQGSVVHRLTSTRG